MTEFTYTAFLPSCDTNVTLKELSFSQYKQLVKLIHNDNNEHIVNAFDSLINDLCSVRTTEMTFLDKLLILLTIRAVNVFPALELTFSATSNQQYNLKFEISDIIEKINNKSVFSTLNNNVKEYSSFRITYGIPDQLYYSNEENLIFSTIKKIESYDNNIFTDITEYKKNIFYKLPAFIYRDAKEYAKSVENEIAKLTLLTVRVPNSTQSDALEISPSVFSDSVLELLKLCYKKDLSSLYELEYFLTSKLNIPYEIISSSTYAELMLYIGFYNEEKKRQEKDEGQKYKNPLSPNR